jgi:acyl dehydratase
LTVRDAGLTWQEMTVGSRFETASRTVSDVDIITFVNTCGFTEPLFLDMDYVARETSYGARVAPGLLSLSLAEGLVIQSGLFHSTGIALLAINFSVLAPVLAGDTIRVSIEVTGSRATKSADRGVVTTRNSVLNQHDAVVMEYEPVRMIRGARPGESPH